MALHKSIDLTQIGGYTFTQDDVDYLQQGFTEAISQLAAVGVNGATPTAITGMAVSGGGNTVADGWFYYNGELIPFTGSTVAPGSGEVAIVEITTTSTSLAFVDTILRPVLVLKTAALIPAPTITDADHFPVSDLASWLVVDPNTTLLLNTINDLRAAWTVEPGVTISVVGPGTIGGGTVDYNSYKFCGKTFDWQMRLMNYAITGTPSVIEIQAPAAFYGGGGTWVNLDSLITAVYDDGGGESICFVKLMNDGGGAPIIRIIHPGGPPWPVTAGLNLYINIRAEIL